MVITQQDIKNTVDSVNYNISSIETILEQKDAVKSTLAKYEKDLKEAENRIQFLSDTKGFYVKAVDLMYEESIGALKDTLNTALKYVIYDKNYSCNLNREDKRGQKYLTISLIDEDENVEVEVKHGVGQGVRAILSFVLRAYYLINQGSKILLLDERYSTISSAYTERFMTFMNSFCEKHDFIIAWITHDERFMPYATKTYVVADGNVRLVSEDDKIVLEEETSKE